MQLLPPTTIGAGNPTGTSDIVIDNPSDLHVQFTVTQVPTGGAPTLDLYFQTSFDEGRIWQDIAHTQFTGVALSRFAALSSYTGTPVIVAQQDGAMTGESVATNGLMGAMFRLKWSFGAGGSTGNYILRAAYTVTRGQ